MDSNQIEQLLEESYHRYNQPSFIPNDPISIPHQYSKLQDIEISGFWAAVLAWGQRKTIIKKANELFTMMDHAPYDFICHHTPADLKQIEHFRHRTFNATDALYFIAFFKDFYQRHYSLEEAFLPSHRYAEEWMEDSLNHFYKQFFALPYAPSRTVKHVASPAKKSACKRINMFLRWMVRHDAQGVDFGLWKRMTPKDLICPCDLHVDRVGRKLGLIQRKQTDWQTAVELTRNLREFDADDPVKYDFALFGLGIEEKF